MLIDEYDYKVLKKAEDITLTNYKIIELLNKEYWVAHDDLIVLIEELITHCKHLQEKVDTE